MSAENKFSVIEISEVTVSTQVLAKRVLEYANYLPHTKKDIEKAVSVCRSENPPICGNGVDAQAFWNNVILKNSGCKRFIEKQRIENLEELIQRYTNYYYTLEQKRSAHECIGDSLF